MKRSIGAKYSGILMCFLIAVAMSCFMSFAMTLLHQGFGKAFFGVWLRSWGVGFMVGFPAALFVVPIVKKFVEFITAEHDYVPVKVLPK